MNDLAGLLMDLDAPQARVAVLLRHFSRLEDRREPWRIAYPLGEVLLLVTCATIASCDDFDDIAAWGKQHEDFLRRFAPFHNGVPCERWMRALVNRVDPVLFGRCFEDWIKALWPGRHDLIAIDGKTARRTHDKAKGLKALHTLSAYATNARLVLASLSVPEKTNEITAIPELLDHPAGSGQLKGAIVTIDAMGCQPAIADKIVAHGADFVLALKGNHPSFEAAVKSCFDSAPPEELSSRTTVEKGHGRIETRITSASSVVDWIKGAKSDPDQPRFQHIQTLVRAVNRTEYKDRCTVDTRTFISSAPCDIDRLANALRGHWGVESMRLPARCRVQRRPVTLPLGPRRQKHGHRPPLRPRPRARQQNQGQRQNSKKISRMEYRLPPRNPSNQMTVNLDSLP